MYELVGRLVVTFLWRAYGRQVKRAAAAGLALTAIGIAAYLAGRSEPEEL